MSYLASPRGWFQEGPYDLTWSQYLIVAATVVTLGLVWVLGRALWRRITRGRWT